MAASAAIRAIAAFVRSRPNMEDALLFLIAKLTVEFAKMARDRYRSFNDANQEQSEKTSIGAKFVQICDATLTQTATVVS